MWLFFLLFWHYALVDWGNGSKSKRKNVDQLSLWCSSKCILICIPVAIHNLACVSGDPMRRWSAMLRSQAECESRSTAGRLRKGKLYLPSDFNVLQPQWFINQKHKINLQQFANHRFSKKILRDFSQFLGAHLCSLFLVWLPQRNSSVSADAFLEKIKKQKPSNNQNRVFSTLTFSSHLGYSWIKSSFYPLQGRESPTFRESHFDQRLKTSIGLKYPKVYFIKELEKKSGSCWWGQW